MRYKFFSPAYLVLAVSMLGCAGATGYATEFCGTRRKLSSVAGLRLSLRCKCV